MVEVCASVASVVSAVLDVGKCLAAPIGRHFMYLYNYKSNFDNLEEEVKKLKVSRDDVKHDVVAAERNVEEIKQNVKDWQEKVDSIIFEAGKFIDEQSNNHRCFNLINRYKHSRKASDKMKAVTDLLQEKGTFGHEVSHPTTHEDIRLISNKDYEAFESRNSTLNDVLKALNDAKVYTIEVYGMGGIGKTTLVKEVGKKAKEGELFDEVVFAEVTDTPEIRKIQEEIADKLGLKFDNETGRADKLYARLKKGKKILIILDNIWEQLDLMTVGIPSGADNGGCKLLLTARDLNVLSKMDSTNNFKMGVLNEEEAWRLFKKMAGDVIKVRELQSLPNDVCKECKGLPIAIVTVAKALKSKPHTSQWKQALGQLKRPSPTNFKGDLKMAYSSIELSYNYLKNEQLKKAFLLCSL